MNSYAKGRDMNGYPGLLRSFFVIMSKMLE